MKKLHPTLLNMSITAILLSLSLNDTVIANDDESQDLEIGTQGDEREGQEPQKKSRFARLKERARKEVNKSTVIQSGKKFASQVGETAKAVKEVGKAAVQTGSAIRKSTVKKGKDQPGSEKQGEETISPDEPKKSSNVKEASRNLAAKTGEAAKEVGKSAYTGTEFGARIATAPLRAEARIVGGVAKRAARRVKEKRELAEQKRAEEQEAKAVEKAAQLKKEREENELQIREKERLDKEQKELSQKTKREELARLDREEAKRRERSLKEAEKVVPELDRELKKQPERKLEQEPNQGKKKPEWMRERETKLRPETPKVVTSKVETPEDIDAKVAELNKKVQEGTISRQSASQQIKVLTDLKKNLIAQMRIKYQRTGNQPSSVLNEPQVENLKTQEGTKPQSVPPSEKKAVQLKVVKALKTDQPIDPKQIIAHQSVVAEMKALEQNPQRNLKPSGNRLIAAKTAQAPKQEVNENTLPSAEEMAEIRKNSIRTVIMNNIKPAKKGEALDLLNNNEPEDKIIEFLSNNSKTPKTQDAIKNEIETANQNKINFRKNPFRN